MSNKRVLGNEFQTAYENAGGTDILKFLADVKQAYRCISDLTARMTAMPDSVKSESVPQLLVQQLDQTTFAESSVRKWEDDLRRFAAYLTPLEPPIAILDSWDTLNDFLEANQALLSSLQNVSLLHEDTQDVKTSTQLLVYPAEPLFQVVQADTGESDAIDLPGLTTADPDGVAEIARTHGVTPFAAFNAQP
ncbi:hypothetical protein [Lacticaseibacillus rhamnosus]|uniref:hypothetical protein n=1 Tax=Lacticaseibacillus rhamnosus TaxID=47715 RepID=UPI0007E1DA3C|nr:hypothetical protein [Lacticaseibacillus rhamnosus]MCZ2733528.1 hypothetical protein [Lacticaseibacillus rhamnosus]MCZ2736259.1 hypothetical protein [Lacticaseibacillus rhamnosus]MCZ2742593.1 hypothetical protein [Lacticaseibacillus rhamnosus]MCZ2745288.1 hypothetical protein [Lacticaseibacillus rhamnosus]MCZ2748024.1 hypothetical protein [Lacticaseibacillus rhamnosus]